jgi:hypothetical protein
MAFERVNWPRCAALSTALFISGAAAQITTPSVLPAQGTFVPPPGVTSLEKPDLADFARRFEAQQQALREQLADPEQRQQLLAERIERLRASSPDLGRVLRIDTSTEERLLVLLVNQELSDEFRPNPFADIRPRTLQAMAASSATSVAREAALYDQHMLQIGKLIGARRLDRYVDYVRTRNTRLQIERLDARLPFAIKLSAAQKDAAVPIFAVDAIRRAQLSVPSVSPMATILGANRPVPPPADDSNQRIQLYNLHNAERQVWITESANQALLRELSKVLTAEQVQAYSQQQAEDLQQLRSREQSLRHDSGLDAEEHLQGYGGKPAPAVFITGNVKLKIRVRVNGNEVTKVATSKRARAVTFSGPAGLWVSAQPALIGSSTLKIELELYEKVGGARRLLGASSSYQIFGMPERDGSVMNGGGAQSLLRGRKAYLLDWSASASPF